MPVLEITNLSKNFAGEHALRNVSFSVEPGALFGLIGADGAGKSTLLRICATVENPDAGHARVLSLDLHHHRRTIRSRIGYMPQRFSLYEDLSVKENMRFFADIFDITGNDRSERIERLLRFSRLGPFQNRRAGNLSGGMKQKLALSCTLIHTPELVILDEPTTGVDPLSRREFWDILREIRDQGVTIVVSTPYMEEAEYCSHLVLLHEGRVVRTGAPSSLTQSYPLRLYRIDAHNTTLHCSRSTPRPAGVSLLYPSRGGLHAAVSDNEMAASRVLDEIKLRVPAAQRITLIQPGIEDVLFYELTRPAATGA